MDNDFQQQSKLSDVQTQTLMLVFASPTPEAATKTIQSQANTVEAAKYLAQQGLIVLRAGGLFVTDKGVAMLDDINVIDKTGKRTPYGEEEFTKATQLTAGPGQQQESAAYPLINSVLNV